MGWRFMALLLSAPFLNSPGHATAIKAGYWPSGNINLTSPALVFTSYFTHVLYAFVQPDPTTFHLLITPQDSTLLSNFTSTLHTHHPPLKALLSIGGGGSSPALFADMTSSRSNRSAFISSTIATARYYNLDGLDLDWEFPANPDQMSNLADLLAEWRAAIDQESQQTCQPPLLLTCAVYFASHFFLSGTPRSYPAAAMAQNLDWAHVMCFDYHGGWDTSATGEHAALFDPHSNVSTSYGIGSWIEAGLPVEKVVMGMPLYGRTWRLRDAGSHGIGAPAVGVGPGASDGTMVYSAVVEFNAANNATVVNDATTGSAYSYAGTSWIGYDDPTTAAWKVEFARGMRLRGYFFWAIGQDYDNSISRTAFITWES